MGKWLCDVCKKRRFETLEEATAHEANCKIHPFFQPPKKVTTKAATGASKMKQSEKKHPNKKPSHPFFEKASKKAKTAERTIDETMNAESFDKVNLLEQQQALDFFSKQKNKHAQQPGAKKGKLSHSRCRGVLAPRFPVPNHVISNEQPISSSAVVPSWPRRSQLSVADALQNHSTKSWLTDTSGVLSTDRDVMLNQAIANAITVTNGPVGSLVERYYYGETIQNSAKQELEEFIERFKMERLEAQNRRKERHDRRQGIRKAKQKKKKRKDDDDDLWEDEEDQVRTTLCLLTGPSGCGKSSMVYNVASSMECKSVLELHPGELRSGSQLRKFMEEATKSHSTRDMLREKNALFTKRQQLVDSDSEEEELSKKGVAVTIILLDEVDTLFEADAGFWPALSDLAKTSKSPIVLTANNIPDGLNTAYTHIRLERPTVTECASRLTEIAKIEGFKIHGSFEQMAILGRCDLRRILHSIHLFAMAPKKAEAATSSSEECLNPRSSTIEDSAPLVERVEPSSIIADECTCLTIYGRNFSSLVSSGEVEVIIGEQICPFAKVINDSTIQTVCQPRRLPLSIDCNGYYRGTRHRSLAIAHPEVIVRTRPRQGISSSNATIVMSLLGEGKKMLAKPRQVLLDVQFHGFTKEETNSDSEENEIDLGPNTAGTQSTIGFQKTPYASDPDVVKKCLSMFEQALTEHPAHTDLVSRIVQTTDSTNCVEVKVLEDVSADCQMVSDAVFLHDLWLDTVPFLSGPCRGFGFTMTDAYPKRTNENSKPPRFQRTFSENWNKDCFFFGCSDAYLQSVRRNNCERNFLSRTEREARGSLLGRKSSEVYEENEPHDHVADEEDMFLPKRVLGSLDSMPLFLMNSVRIWRAPSLLQWCTAISERDYARSQCLYFLTDMVYAGENKISFRFNVSNRSSETISNAPEYRQQSFFLDHLPMIRCNLISDTARAKTDDDSERPGRRSRRRALRQRPSFIEDLIPPYVRRDNSSLFQISTLQLLTSALHQTS